MKFKMPAAVARFVADEEAATAAEYGLLAAMIGSALIIGLNVFGPKLQNAFIGISNRLNVN